MMKKSCILLSLILTGTALSAAHPGIESDEWGEPVAADFSDGWILPYFGKTGVWKVEVRKSRDGERYLITDPYHQRGFAELFPEGVPNTDDVHDMVVDCTDPEYVTIEAAEIFAFKAGSYDDNSVQTVWGQTRAGYLEAASGYDRATLTEAGLNSTFANNVITLRACTVGFSADAYQCGSTLSADGSFHDTCVWLDKSGNLAVETWSERETGPQYYTLTGQPVGRPLAGTLVLVRRGATVTKTVVR